MFLMANIRHPLLLPILAALPGRSLVESLNGHVFFAQNRNFEEKNALYKAPRFLLSAGHGEAGVSRRFRIRNLASDTNCAKDY